MYSFISKADNKNSLCNNHTNINDNKNECPLDNMRKSLIDKLNEIDSLLETKMINYIEKKINNELTNDNFDLINRYNDLFMKAEELIRSNLLVAFEVLKHLEGHNKTLIILGPNGSGKTSFANYLKNVDSHIKVIPADKPIKTYGNIPGYFSSFEMFNNELYGNNGTVDNNILQTRKNQSKRLYC